MKIQSVQGYNSTKNNQSKGDYLNSPLTNSFNSKDSYSPSFGIGARAAMVESIAEGEKIFAMGKNSPELVDMAERFHTCPEIVIQRVSAVYEWASAWMLLGINDYNEAKSQMAFEKLSTAVKKVIHEKPTMSSERLRSVNAKAQKCYENYKMYSDI